jgi:Galactose oxidase, central domain
MVFDEARQVMVMFGGYSANSDTWEWDGFDWAQRVTAHAPSPRYHFGMSYDSDRHRTVLFGGAVPGGLADNEIWEYDGVDWQSVTPVGSEAPAPRYALGQAYDSIRHQTLIFGGISTAVTNELWQWDGAARTWNRGVAGPARYYPMMSFDAAVGNAVVFGGAGQLNDTWLWNGSDWKLASVSRSPDGRHGAELTYDSRRRTLFLFGGFTDKAEGDLWQHFHGAPGVWVKRQAANIPSQRVYQQAAYSASKGELVMFGGGGASADTWRWQSATGWTKLLDSGYSDIAGQPRNRQAAMMVYDSKRERYLMFGGLNVGNFLFYDDMWSFAGGSWHEMALSIRPSARNSVGAYYDAGRDRIVIFGGINQYGQLAETWEFDCQTDGWEQVATQGQPPASYGGAMVYDQHRDRGVLVPGYGNSTWFYQVSGATRTWTQYASSASAPSQRRYAAGIYHALRKSIILVGGEAGPRLGDTWEFRDDQWDELFTASSPPARHGGAAAYDVATSTMMLFGGSNVGYLNDTWLLRWSGAPDQPQDCPAATLPPAGDTDGDGLDSEADPDCWWRRTPLCPPGTSCLP